MNPLLAANLFTESLHRKMEEKGYSFISFSFHLGEEGKTTLQDLMILNHLFDNFWQFGYDNGKFKVYFRVDSSSLEKEWSCSYHDNGDLKTAFLFDPSKGLSKEDDFKNGFSIPPLDTLRDKVYLSSQDKEKLLELRNLLIDRQAEHNLLESANEVELAIWDELTSAAN